MFSAGNTRGLIEAAQRQFFTDRASAPFSAGNTRGLIEASLTCPNGDPSHVERTFSAGNTRGLIEAEWRSLLSWLPASRCFPRGIPAASLKQITDHATLPSPQIARFSAGNTRGLIEAAVRGSHYGTGMCFPRGIPAASLKQALCQVSIEHGYRTFSAGNTRGLIEANRVRSSHPACSTVFRGEYPRPH